MSAALTTDADLAEQFGITTKKLHELRKRYRWPCVKLGRFEVRFTAEQVEQIVVMQTEAPESARPVRVPSLAGQTARSAAQRRSL